MAPYETFRGIIFTFGLVLALICHRLMQEHIMSRSYGHHNETFDVAIFLVFCHRLAGLLLALITMKVRGESFASEAPWTEYGIVSFSNVICTSCQYEGLLFVGWALQLIANSFKMIPIMTWNWILSDKKFPTSSWMLALFITGGIVLYVVGDNIHTNENTNLFYAAILMVVFLVSDGFQATYEEKIFKEFAPTACEQMCTVDILSCILCLGVMFPLDYLPKVYFFCVMHPPFIMDVILLSTAAAVSQCFLYALVKSNGALSVAVARNISLVTSVVAQTVTYGHPITPSQIAALAVVILALLHTSVTTFFPGYFDREEKSSIVEKEDCNVP